MRIGLAAIVLLAIALPAWAHGEGAGEFGDGWLTVAFAWTLLLYAIGIARLWSGAGAGRGMGPGKAGLFLAGWATLALALVSPVISIAFTSFAAHMVEHEVLIIVAAPLLVLSRPLGALVWALPPAIRRTVGRVTRSRGFARPWNRILEPGSAWALHAAALWAWHMPRLFEAALVDPLIHDVQHASLLGAALIYWWSLLRPAARGHRGISILSLFATSIHTSLLGALIAVSSTVWYPSYRVGAGAFGLSPLEDQQLAGLIMWVPGGLVYLGAALTLTYTVLRRSARPAGVGGIHVARP